MTPETTKKVRPKAPRVTYFIQIQSFGVFVVEAEKFIRDGGDYTTGLWMPTLAETELDARVMGEQLIVKLGGKK